MLNYDALDSLVQKQKWWFTASELHGILSALSALDKDDQWAVLLALGEDATMQALAPEMLEKIAHNLHSSSLNFALLLPEERPFSEKAEALASWSEGFHLAASYLAEENKLPILDDTSKEFIHDTGEIAKLDSHLPDSEENRQMLNDLEEHLRIGALTLYATTHHTK